MNNGKLKQSLLLVTFAIIIYLILATQYLLSKYQDLDASGKLVSRTINLFDPVIIAFRIVLIIWIILIIKVIMNLGNNKVQSIDKKATIDNKNIESEQDENKDLKRKKIIQAKSNKLKPKSPTGKKAIKKSSRKSNIKTRK